jgi:ornithine cyclodeaminase
MTAALPIYTIEMLRPLLNRAEVISVVRSALIRHAEGAVQSPMPGQLTFPDVNGDCHIKYGYMSGAKHFVVKVATGFYHNPQRGLAVNNGLMLLFDATTGAPRCLFQDEGSMTAWRTAAAVALAAHCLAPRHDPAFGIVGTGQQAQLAIEWVAELLPSAHFTLLGRDPDRTQELGRLLNVAPARSMKALLDKCDLIITATPSAEALFDANDAREGQHFVGVGADGREKQEIPERLYSRANMIVTDDHSQCLELSDFGRAVRAGQVAADADVTLGHVLTGARPFNRRPSDITVADLTGLAAQDIAIANLFFGKLADADA